MKKTIYYLFLMISLVSCQAERQESVVLLPTETMVGLVTVAVTTQERVMIEPTAVEIAVEAESATVSSVTVMPIAPLPTVTETAVPTSTPNPESHPLYPYTIAGLKEREGVAGEIRVHFVLRDDEEFTQTYISYPSDGLRITGVMHTPMGAGPFPVLLLLHGYYERDDYYSGADTSEVAGYFVRNGYITIAPDYRSWGEADDGLSLFHTGLVADVLNLIDALPSLAKADPENVGLWGHSMGGGVATKLLIVGGEQIKAAVLYAPNSPDDADLIGRWGAGCLPGQDWEIDPCNPGEMIPEGTDPELIAAYFAGAKDPDFMRRVAPYYYLNEIDVPVQVHIGTLDGAELEQTPVEWSAKLVTELEKTNEEVTYFVYPDQGHYLRGESWIALVGRSLELFNQEMR